jgi:hypothetical protein
MDNFRRFLKQTLDAITDETAAAVRQAARASKKGTSYHAEVSAALGLQGEVTEDSTGGYDVKIAATVPIANAVIGGAMITPSAGFSSGTSGNFLGPGQMQVTARIVVVNAQALESGVDASDPNGVN